jgi:hypothetical protein
MTSIEGDTLLVRVAELLDQKHVRCALIGAAALAVHGISRSTLDIDLLIVDPSALAAGFWSGLPADIRVDVRIGDASDPLAGVVRFSTARARDVDLVVGRASWQADVVARAISLPRGGRAIPTALASDLVLLKLYAGGTQDRWDIDQLLARPDQQQLIDDVERELPRLPAAARRLWTTWRPVLREE